MDGFSSSSPSDCSLNFLLDSEAFASLLIPFSSLSSTEQEQKISIFMPLRMRTRDFSSLFPLQRLFRLFHFPEMALRPMDLGPIGEEQPRDAMTLAGCRLAGPFGEEIFCPYSDVKIFPGKLAIPSVIKI